MMNIGVQFLPLKMKLVYQFEINLILIMVWFWTQNFKLCIKIHFYEKDYQPKVEHRLFIVKKKKVYLYTLAHAKRVENNVQHAVTLDFCEIF